MPSNQTINIVANTITSITSNDVTACRIQNQSGYPIQILASFGATPPNNTNGAFVLLPYQAIGADILISEIFPGIANANRLYVFSQEPVQISVSHA